jgi:hypothetical protein
MNYWTGKFFPRPLALFKKGETTLAPSPPKRRLTLDPNHIHEQPFDMDPLRAIDLFHLEIQP